MTDEELRDVYQRDVAGRAAASRAACPEPEQLAALVECAGGEAERIATLNHAMACPRCHPELALLQAMHAAGARAAPVVRPLARWGWRAAAGLVVALAGGAGLLARSSAGPAVADHGDVTRGAGDAGSVTLVGARAATAPDATGPMAWRLVWHPVGGAVGYQVEVLGADDQVLFSRQTADTSLLAAVPRGAGRPTWWVRAAMGDGTEQRSVIAPLVP